MSKPRQAPLLPSEWPEPEDLGAPPEREKKGPEESFALQCLAYRLPKFQRQLKFAKSIGRQWKFDFAFPDYHLAVEINGIVMRRIGGELVCMGRHATITGIRGDNEKLNTAALLGWTVLQFLQSDVGKRLAIETTMRVLAARGWSSD